MDIYLSLIHICSGKRAYGCCGRKETSGRKSGVYPSGCLLYTSRRVYETAVKPGTKTDTKVRLKGKGVPSLRNAQVRGDHYVTLVIQTPEKLSAEAKEALRKFDLLAGNTPVSYTHLDVYKRQVLALKTKEC